MQHNEQNLKALSYAHRTTTAQYLLTRSFKPLLADLIRFLEWLTLDLGTAFSTPSHSKTSACASCGTKAPLGPPRDGTKECSCSVAKSQPSRNEDRDLTGVSKNDGTEKVVDVLATRKVTSL